MADFEKVYEIKFSTRSAQAALKRLDNGLVKIDKSAIATGATFQRSVGKVSTDAVNKLNKRLGVTRVNLRKLRSGLDTVARKTAMAAAAFVAIGGVSVRNVIKLNEGLANVGTLLDGGINKAERFRRGLQDMAIDTGKSTDDLTEGLYQVVSALGEVDENMDQLNQASKAAVAGRSSTLGAINMLAAVTKGYGDTSAKAMEHVSDLAFQTVKLGQTTFPELAASIGKVVPLAAAMNTSQEELFGTMATLTGVTGDTSEVTTQLASVYASFMKPSEAMTKLAQKQGFESATAMVKTIGFAKSIKLLGKETGGEADQVAKFIRRKEGQIAVLALTGGQTDTYTQKLEKMKSVAGATEQAFKTQTEGINKQGHEWEKTKRRLEVFSQRVGERLLPVLDKLLDKLEPIFKWLENIDEEAIESAMQFAKWTIIIAGASKALSGLLGVVQALGTMKTLMTGLTAATGGMRGFAGATGTATTALSGFLAKAGAVAGAGALGYAAGSALYDTVLGPQAKRRSRKQEELSELAFQARQARKRGSMEEQQTALKKLSDAQKAAKEDWMPSIDELAGTAASVFTGEKSPGQKRGEIIGEAAFEMGALRKEIMAGRSQRFRDIESEYGIAPQQTVMPSLGGRSNGVTQNNTTNLTVNTQASDGPGVARVVKRELDRRDKKTAEQIRRVRRGAAAAEQ